MRLPDLDFDEPDDPGSLLAPLSDTDYEELMADPIPTVRREPPTILLVRCPGCRTFLTAGAKRAGECTDCGERVTPATA